MEKKKKLNDDHSETFSHSKLTQAQLVNVSKMTVRSVFGPFHFRGNAINRNEEINGPSATLQFTTSNEWGTEAISHVVRVHGIFFCNLRDNNLTIKIEIACHMASSPYCCPFLHSIPKQFQIEYQQCLMSTECYGYVMVIRYHSCQLRHNPINISYDFRSNTMILEQHSHPACLQTHRSARFEVE